MTTVQSARSYKELLGDAVEASPYDYAVLFKADGFMARQRSRKRFKLLKAIDPKLRLILDRGEKVYFLTPGAAISMGERFFAGWLAYCVNMRALVFTSRRILLIHINARQRPLELVSQLPYASIASVKSTWNGLCAVKLLNRERLNFQYVPGADRKFLVGFLADLVQLSNAPFEQKRGIEHLCPHCFVFVPGHPSACPACTGRFKSARKAGLLSLLFPGVGGWYLGHRWLALFEMLGTGALWYFLVIGPLLGVADWRSAPFDSEYWMTVGAIILLAHVIDGMMAHHFGRKGHHPSGEAPLPASLPPFVDRPKPDLNPLNKLKISRSTPPDLLA
jgi:hypothetical protein